MLKKLLLTAAVLIGSISLTGCGSEKQEVAASGTIAIKEGVHYQVLEKTFDAPKNQVLEFFWYGCPHCFSAEKVVKPWAEQTKNKYQFVKRHSHLNNSWMFDAFIYYGLNALGIEETVGYEYFVKRQNGGFEDEEAINDWLITQGTSRKELNNAAADPKTIELRDQMVLIEQSIDAGGVPAFVVAGKYKVLLSGLQDFGGWPGLTTVLEQLLDKAEKEK